MAQHASRISHKAHSNSRVRKETVLATELKTFEANLPSLLQDAPGKFVVINGRKIIGLADDYAHALRLGYNQLGSDAPFFVEQIQDPKLSARRSKVFLTRVELLKNG